MPTSATLHCSAMQRDCSRWSVAPATQQILLEHVPRTEVVDAADAQRLSGELPTVLREALLARWHSLPEPARQVTRLLAVGGRPTSFETLGAVTAGVVPAAELPALVREAVEAGVLQQVGEQTCWFRHPLLAEVLLGTLTSQERAPVHAAYAQALEASAANRPDLAGALSADLAVHHEGAGHFDRAFVFSIRAADFAHELHASSVETAHLTRACEVWERAGHEVTGPTQDRIDLLLRTSRAGEQAGVLETTRFLDQALSLVDRQHQPLLASTMLVEWSWSMAWGNSRPPDDQSPQVRPEVLEAVELTRPFPDSPERACALDAARGCDAVGPARKSAAGGDLGSGPGGRGSGPAQRFSGSHGTCAVQ